METSASVTANRRYIEVEIAEEGTTITFLLDQGEADYLVDEMEDALKKLRRDAVVES